MRLIPAIQFCTLLVCAVPLASCQSTVSPAGKQPTADASSDAAPTTLTGEYRVAGIDGQEVSSGIALTVTATVIGFDPRCAGFTWTYTYGDGVLTTNRPEKPRSADGPDVARPMRPVCRIAVHPEQRSLANALDAVTKAARTPSNGIELSGAGRSVLLYTQ